MVDQNRKIGVLGYALIVALFGGLGFGAFLLQSGGEIKPLELEQAFVLEPPRMIKWNELIAQDRSVFTPEQMRGKWSYLYMGYRSCPDVCPVAMSVLGNVAKKLADQKLASEQQPQFLFMSVDPQRDTPELLSEYVAFFGEDFKGITGQHEQLRAVSLQLGAIFYVPENPETDDYEVGHSDSIFVFNPEGQLRLISRPPHDAEMIVRNHLRLFE